MKKKISIIKTNISKIKKLDALQIYGKKSRIWGKK